MKLTHAQAKLLEPFVEATISCLKTMAGLDAVPGHGSQEALDTFCTDDYMFVVETQGQISGRIIMRYYMDTTLDIGNKIREGLLGQECGQVEVVDEEIIDALSELSNIIVGRSIQSLEDQNIPVSFRPPIYITDSEKPTFLKSGVKEILTVPVDVEGVGKFHVHYMIQNAAES